MPGEQAIQHVLNIQIVSLQRATIHQISKDNASVLVLGMQITFPTKFLIFLNSSL